jgi:guanylate kinase
MGEPEQAYNFVSREAFLAHVRAGGFLEWVELLPDYFMGTPLPDADHDWLFEIDVRGAAAIRDKFPDALLVFIAPPDKDTLRQRMCQRGDSPEHIERRLQLAEPEMQEASKFDHVIVNDDLNETLQELKDLVVDFAKRFHA